jgi:EpsD family peptidyl-prolyl cis-trans isomerase
MNNGFAQKFSLPVLLVAMLSVGACGDKKASEEKGGTQVAAKVNGNELTVHEVNFALQRLPNLTKENSKAASLQVVRSLVDQEVLVQQSVADKLDRDPIVVQAMEAARKQILAQVYIDRKLGTTATPTSKDVSDYYAAHPELFAQRKVYRLQEIAITASKDKLDGIRTKLAASKDLNEFGIWLKAQAYPFKVAQGVKGPEQVPPQLLPKLQTMPTGQAMLVNTPDGLLVIVMAGSQDQPVTEAQAKPAIENFLKNQKRQEAAKQVLDQLKAKAKIEYVGDFSDAAKSAEAPKPSSPETKLPAGEGKPAAATQDAISKGVSGLN